MAWLTLSLNHSIFTHKLSLHEQNAGNQFQYFSQPFNAALGNSLPQGENGFLGQNLFSTNWPGSGSNGLFGDSIYQQSHIKPAFQPHRAELSSHVQTKPRSLQTLLPNLAIRATGPAVTAPSAAPQTELAISGQKHGNAEPCYCREPGCEKGAGYGKAYSRVDKRPLVAFSLQLS